MTHTLPLRLDASLDDKYTLTEGWAYMTGTQALVRLALDQRRRDVAAGHHTAGFISGYQGSPLAAIDGALRKTSKLLQENHIVFRPGVNEELGATSVWGSQYVNMFPGAKYDGVFGLWYGKGPGLDRAMDALRHANWAGTSRLGGSLALVGDDHGAKSSTVACYSDIALESLGMPVLYPSNVQEILDYGLHGIAMSRYSGAWASLKLVTDVVESASVLQLSPEHPHITLPDADATFDTERWIQPASLATILPAEETLYHRRLYAALAYARANGINRITHDAREAWLGIVCAGKTYHEVRKALANLGLDAERALAAGVRVLKLGMVWPVDPEIVRQFARGLRTVLVVEEKRPLVEDQVRSILYGAPDAPRVLGKVRTGHLFDASPAWLFPNAGEINALMVTRVLSQVLAERDPSFANWQAPPNTVALQSTPAVRRTPSFCSGCPHNRSTKLPPGSRTLGGIGCHGMQLILDPANCKTISQMGGEGAQWVGQQPFTQERHVFANLGDGTYAHSGSLAIRHAVAAGVPITYKLLANGFVSMTGGQPISGGQTVPQMVEALRADGVQRIAVVTDDLQKYAGVQFPAGVPLLPRNEMERVQAEMREFPGVSAIIYEQPCATERRRLRKQGQWEDPPKRSFIHSAVCEGCGDCGKVSTCLSIEPLDTEFGRKRRINQSTCNKDFSCVEGFCPSFVTVHGGRLRKPEKSATAPQRFDVPEPEHAPLTAPVHVLVGGIGGTGVVTIGQVLAMAAYVDGTPCLSLDVMGLAQKYGAVYSHLHFAPSAEQLTAPRIGPGEADTLIGCDLIVASGDEPVSMLAPGRSHAVLCSEVTATAEFARNPDWDASPEQLIERVRRVTGDATTLVEGQRLAVALLGDAIACNMLMVGVAWQRGLLPLSLAAIERAIELNGVSVAMNREAFHWGRCIAHDPARVERMVSGAQVIQFRPRHAQPNLEETIARHVAYLTEYQNAAYAKRYQNFIAEVQRADTQAAHKQALSLAVAQSYFKLLATKDEWEVARLYTLPSFRAEIEQTFEGDYELHFHIGGGPFAKTDPQTGKAVKREVGPWLLRAFTVMARLRGLRGTLFDPFRHGAERKLEQALLAQYEQDLRTLLPRLNADNYTQVVAFAALPQKIRGFGHVKLANAQATASERERLLQALAIQATPAPVAQSLTRAA